MVAVSTSTSTMRKVVISKFEISIVNGSEVTKVKIPTTLTAETVKVFVKDLKAAIAKFAECEVEVSGNSSTITATADAKKSLVIDKSIFIHIAGEERKLYVTGTTISLPEGMQKIFSMKRPAIETPDRYGFSEAEHYVRNWKYHSGKTGGAQDSGPLGGIYTRGDQMAMIKRESASGAPKNGVIIAEFIASEILHRLIPGHMARGFLASAQEDVTKPIEPSADGKDVYFVSPFLANYQDLFAYAGLDKRYRAEGTRSKLGSDTPVKQVLTSGVIVDFEKPIVPSMLVKDLDIHSGNKGVVAVLVGEIVDGKLNGQSVKVVKQEITKGSEVKTTIDKVVSLDGKVVFGELKDGKVYQQRLVRIDYGGALRALTGVVNVTSSELKEIAAARPTNHITDYPKELRFTREMAAEIHKESAVDLGDTIDSAMTEVAKYYGVEPIRAFGVRLGVTEITDITDKDLLIGKIKKFLKDVMKERQAHYKRHATKIELGLCRDNEKSKRERARFSRKRRNPDEYKYTDSDGKEVTLKDVILRHPQFFLDLSPSKELHIYSPKGKYVCRSATKGLRKEVLDKAHSMLAILTLYNKENCDALTVANIIVEEKRKKGEDITLTEVTNMLAESFTLQQHKEILALIKQPAKLLEKYEGITNSLGFIVSGALAGTIRLIGSKGRGVRRAVTGLFAPVAPDTESSTPEESDSDEHEIDDGVPSSSQDWAANPKPIVKTAKQGDIVPGFGRFELPEFFPGEKRVQSAFDYTTSHPYKVTFGAVGVLASGVICRNPAILHAAGTAIMTVATATATPYVAGVTIVAAALYGMKQLVEKVTEKIMIG